MGYTNDLGNGAQGADSSCAARITVAAKQTTSRPLQMPKEYLTDMSRCESASNILCELYALRRTARQAILATGQPAA
jgi:hypothetical protein